MVIIYQIQYYVYVCYVYMYIMCLYVCILCICIIHVYYYVYIYIYIYIEIYVHTYMYSTSHWFNKLWHSFTPNGGLFYASAMCLQCAVRWFPVQMSLLEQPSNSVALSHNNSKPQGLGGGEQIMSLKWRVSNPVSKYVECAEMSARAKGISRARILTLICTLFARIRRLRKSLQYLLLVILHWNM